ncbi:MAG: hypothetical protein CMJ58_13860 [Planctomycetaceae bacterium]|nr:hypothetical protein [Planctomycetaceae bacterium]
MCFAGAAFMAFVIVMSVVNRIFWHHGYSIVEDIVVFAGMGLILLVLIAAGRFLGPSEEPEVPATPGRDQSHSAKIL